MFATCFVLSISPSYVGVMDACIYVYLHSNWQIAVKDSARTVGASRLVYCQVGLQYGSLC
jgi:hypothetical protein